MVMEITGNNFDAEVMKSSIPVIVDFWASWCGPCMMLKPIFEKVSADYTGKLKFAKVNTENNGELAGAHGIMSIPCLIMFSGGKEVGRIVGSMPEGMLKQKIDALLVKV